MKKILFAFLAAVLVFSVSGCDKKGDKEETTSVSISTAETTTQSIASMDDGLQGDGTNQNEPEPYEIEIKKYGDLPLYNITSVEEIDHPFGNFNGSIGCQLLAYGDNKILFARVYPAQRPYEPTTQHLLLYDAKKGDEEFIFERISPNYGSENYLFLGDRYYVRGAWLSEFKSVIYVTDVITKETSAFDDLPSRSRRFTEYSGHEFICFDSDYDHYYQNVSLYNIKTGEVREIVDNVSAGENSIKITGVDVCDGKIYVLFHGRADGKNYTFIRVYDGDGNIIDNISDVKFGSGLSHLEGYYFSVTAFYVFGDYFFLEVNGELFFGFEYKNDRLTLFYGVDGNRASNDPAPNETPVSGVIGGRYVLFTGRSEIEVEPGERELEFMLFDMLTGEMSRFALRIGDSYKIADSGTYVDKNGDMVLTVFYGDDYFDENGEYHSYDTVYFRLGLDELLGYTR